MLSFPWPLSLCRWPCCGGLSALAMLMLAAVLALSIAPQAVNAQAQQSPLIESLDPTPRAPQAGALAPLAPDAVPASEDPMVALFLQTYRVSSGDVVSVRVLGQPELSITGARISDSGVIFLPFYGELRISGLTIRQIEDTMLALLTGRYLVNPRVFVTIDQYRPFFINGEINRPGAYSYQPGLTVRKATALAGGLKDRASMRRSFIIRDTDRGVKEEQITLDTRIFPGDVVTIGESFF